MIGEWPFPPLRGVIATQTMRYDGTLLTKPGYDPATGLVLFNPPPMPAIPDQPTKQDALDALALLSDLLTEVDFAEDDNVSLSGAISMLMTPGAARHDGGRADARRHQAGRRNRRLLHAGHHRRHRHRRTLPGALAHAEQRRRERKAAVLRRALRAADHRHRQLHRHADGRLPLPTDRTPDAASPPARQIRTGDHHQQPLRRRQRQQRDHRRRYRAPHRADQPRRQRGEPGDAAPSRATRWPKCWPIAAATSPPSSPSPAPTASPAAREAAAPPQLRGLVATTSAPPWSGSAGRIPDESIKAVRAADPISAKLHAVIAAWATELTVDIGYYTSELVSLASEYLHRQH